MASTKLVKAGNFGILNSKTAEEMQGILAENFEGVKITPNDLEIIKFPTGGQLAWAIEIEGETSFEKMFAAIILSVRTIRVYWEKGIDEREGEVTPPDCFSTDGEEGNGDPGGLCHKCPKAQFGSGRKGRGQACKEMREIIILRPDSMLPSIVRVPPTSLKEVSKYMRQLGQSHRRRSAVITEFGLQHAKNVEGIEYSTLTLKTTSDQILTTDEAEKIKQYAADMASIISGFGQTSENYAEGNSGE